MRNLAWASVLVLAVAFSLVSTATSRAEGAPAAEAAAATAAPRTADDVRKDIRTISTKLSLARQELAKTDPDMKALAAEVEALEKKRAEINAKQEARAEAASPEYKALHDKAEALQKELEQLAPHAPATRPAAARHEAKPADAPVRK